MQVVLLRPTSVSIHAGSPYSHPCLSLSLLEVLVCASVCRMILLSAHLKFFFSACTSPLSMLLSPAVWVCLVSFYVADRCVFSYVAVSLTTMSCLCMSSFFRFSVCRCFYAYLCLMHGHHYFKTDDLPISMLCYDDPIVVVIECWGVGGRATTPTQGVSVREEEREREVVTQRERGGWRMSYV